MKHATLNKVSKKGSKSPVVDPLGIELRLKYGVRNVQIVDKVPSKEFFQKMGVLNVSVQVEKEWFFVIEGKRTLAFHNWRDNPTYYEVVETIRSIGRLSASSWWIWQEVLDQFRKNVMGR